MQKKYYIPIESTALAHYFAEACIYPANFYQNKPKDIQDEFPNAILMTINQGYDKCNCCLQIVLTEEEEEFLVAIDNGYYLIDKVIPISRISKIMFDSDEQKQQTIALIRQATAFIPETIIVAPSEFESKEIIANNRPENFEGIRCDDIAEKRSFFDRILGALALMNTAKTEGMTHSPKYIDTISFFNTIIKQQKTSVREIDTKYPLYFDASNKYAIWNQITEEFLYNEAKRCKTQIKKDPITRIIETDSLESPVYEYAILYTYGVADESRKKKIDDLILTNFQKGVKKNFEERIAFFYGFNRGYKAFNNTYMMDSKTVEVKFRLESQLDYYIIESVYQYVFNNRISGELPYIDSWCPKNDARTPKSGEYLILDTIVKDRKRIKVFSEEWWKQILTGFSKDSKCKINLLGKDVEIPIDIENTLLRPFAEKIGKDIREEVTEEYRTIIEADSKEIESLKREISNLKKSYSQYGLNNQKVAQPVFSEPTAEYGQKDILKKPKSRKKSSKKEITDSGTVEKSLFDGNKDI